MGTRFSQPVQIAATFCPVLELYLGANPHNITLNEAGALKNVLDQNGSAGAVALRHSIDAATEGATPPAIHLSPDDIAALRDAICGDLFIGFPGLTSLQNAVCLEGFPGKGLESAFGAEEPPAQGLRDRLRHFSR